MSAGWLGAMLLTSALSVPGHARDRRYIDIYGPETDSAEAPPVEISDADPWGSLALADTLYQRGRTDEAVAILHGAHTGATSAAAARRLRPILLSLAPRGAWQPVIADLRRDDPGDFELHLLDLRSQVLDPEMRPRATVALQRMLRERPDSLAALQALAEAYLRSGQLSRARALLKDASGGSVAELDAVALLGLGKGERAVDILGEDLPFPCRSSGAPIQCAQALTQMGWPEVGSLSLRLALDRRAHSQISSTRGRASAYATLAAMETTLGRDEAALRAWREAARLQPSERVYQQRAVEAMLEAGRVSAALSLIRKDEDALRRAAQAVRLVSRADTWRPGSGPALEKARRLAPEHPIVVRAWAEYLLMQGRAPEAFAVLDPQISAHAADRSWLDLYTWAAAVTGEPGNGPGAIQEALPTIRRADDWMAAIRALSRLRSLAAERDKRAGEAAAATTGYRLARALYPESIATTAGLGGALWHAGQLAEAQRAYLDAWERAPGNRQALFSLVSVLIQQGEFGVARQHLGRSGYSDLQVRLLDEKLQVSAASQPARDDLAEGRPESAARRFSELIERYPHHAQLHHGLGDALTAMGSYDAAIDAYVAAQKLDPEDPWPFVGEIGALIALGELSWARELLETVADREGVPGLAEALGDIHRRLAQAEADALTRAGRADEAFEIYRQLLDERVESWVLTGIGRLYMSRWQYGAAQMVFEEAFLMDARDTAAARGRIQAMLARGFAAAAQQEVGELCRRDPTSENLKLAEEVDRYIQIEQAFIAAIRGERAVAAETIHSQLQAYPESPDLQAASAQLLLHGGDAASALENSQAIAQVHPTHSGALAVAQRAGLRSRRSGDVLSLYLRAIDAGGEAWLLSELPVLRLATELDDALLAPESAPEVIADLEARYGSCDARRWGLLAGAWQTVGDVDRATRAWETARACDPDSSGAVLGLARLRRSTGAHLRAELLLSSHWEAHRDIEVGAALAEIHIELGHRRMARTVVEDLQAEVDAGRIRVSRSAPPELPLIPLPSGRALPARDPGARPPGLPTIPDVDLGALEQAFTQRFPPAWDVGAGWVHTSGEPGTQQFDVWFTPAALEVVLAGPLRATAEVVFVQLDDGLRSREGVALSGGLATREEAPLSGRALLGVTPLGLHTPAQTASSRLLWHTRLVARAGRGGEAMVEWTRAPVTDTLTSWAGIVEAPPSEQATGPVTDTWLGGRLSGATPSAVGLGLQVRAGTTRGADLTTVPWEQGLAWLQGPLLRRERLSIWGTAESMLLDHDRQVGGFSEDQAGMFSPDFYYSASGRLNALLDLERWSMCAGASAGPQWVFGEDTLYVGAGQFTGVVAGGGVRRSLGGSWALQLSGQHQTTLGTWQQSTVSVHLRRGVPDGGIRVPGPLLSSAVHGLPFSAAAGCTDTWTEWRP